MNIHCFQLFNTLRRDSCVSSGGKSTRGGGLLTYIHSDLYFITERRVPNVDMEYIYIYTLTKVEHHPIFLSIYFFTSTVKTIK